MKIEERKNSCIHVYLRQIRFEKYLVEILVEISYNLFDYGRGDYTGTYMREFRMPRGKPLQRYLA